MPELKIPVVEHSSNQPRLLWCSSIFLIIFLSHRAYTCLGMGIEFDAAPLTWYLQFIDTALLRHRLWESIWYLYDQPPLFNAVVGMILQAFPNTWQTVLSWAYLCSGGILWLLVFLGACKSGVRTPLALLFTSVAALSPACVLYERLLFYTHPVSFLVSLLFYLLLQYLDRPAIWRGLLVFFTSALLFLSRGFFGWHWFFGLVAIVAYYAPGCRRMTFRAAAVPALLVIAMVLKNLLMWGQTSEGGTFAAINLAYRQAHYISTSTIDDLISKRIISRLIRLNPLPSVDELVTNGIMPAPPVTGIQLLDLEFKTGGAINAHNIAYHRLKDEYLSIFSSLLHLDPYAYLRGTVALLPDFFLPAAQHFALLSNENVRKIRSYEQWYARYVLVQLFPGSLSLLMLVGLPLALTYAALLWLCAPQSPTEKVHRALWGFACFTIGSLLLPVLFISWADFNRYRAEIDPLLVILAAKVANDIIFRCGASPRLNSRKDQITNVAFTPPPQ